VTGHDAAADALAAAAMAVPFPVRIVHRLAAGAVVAPDHPAAALIADRSQALVCAGDRCGLPVTTPAALSQRVAEMTLGRGV
jgi:uncharacterized protein YyaL (SSP411 family)